MGERIRSHLTYANVVATLALFLVIAGGTAAAVTYVVSSNSQVGPNTISGHRPPSGKHANIIPASVNGQDVADNSLRGADINELTLGAVPNLAANSVDSSKVLDGSLTGYDVANNSLGGQQIANNSLGGQQIADNSLGGQQIAESTLGEVPLAQVGGFGRDRYGGSCYPNGAAYVDCVVMRVNLPTRSPVLLIGATEAAPQNGDAKGACKLVTQFGDVPYTAVDYHLHGGDAVSGSLVGITGLLGPGPVDFGIDCNKFSGTMEYFAHLAALQIAPN
jgi:hypothetical protein